MKKILRHILAGVAVLVSAASVLFVCAAIGTLVSGLTFSLWSALTWSFETLGWPGPLAVAVALICLGFVLVGMLREALKEEPKKK